jgi:hypothetical protein
VLDLSQGQLESRNEKSKRVYQLLAVFSASVGIVGFIWMIVIGNFEWSLNLLNLVFPTLIAILPATGWFYRKHAHYLKLDEEKLVYKPKGRSERVFLKAEIQSLDFSNKHLKITTKDGHKVDYLLQGPTLSYNKVQELKDKFAHFLAV